MPSLEELRRENRKLKAQAEVREDFRKRDIEKKRLARENIRLRRPKTFAFLGGVKRVGKAAGARAGTAGKKFLEKQRKIAKQEAKKKGRGKSARKVSVSDFI